MYMHAMRGRNTVYLQLNSQPAACLHFHLRDFTDWKTCPNLSRASAESPLRISANAHGFLGVRRPLGTPPDSAQIDREWHERLPWRSCSSVQRVPVWPVRRCYLFIQQQPRPVRCGPTTQCCDHITSSILEWTAVAHPFQQPGALVSTEKRPPQRRQQNNDRPAGHESLRVLAALLYVDWLCVLAQCGRNRQQGQQGVLDLFEGLLGHLHPLQFRQLLHRASAASGDNKCRGVLCLEPDAELFGSPARIGHEARGRLWGFSLDALLLVDSERARELK